MANEKRYNIYYRKYNIIANAYIPYVKVVYTNDIYHEIGKMIYCVTSIPYSAAIIKDMKKAGYKVKVEE